jgi:CubicO group peptidase (beta-lactamase class C family)
VRHGKIFAEAYYGPYTAGIPHAMRSATKAVISTLTAIAFNDGLLHSTGHRVLDFFDRCGISNLSDGKENITVQNLLDMTSGLEWTEPLSGRPISTIEMEPEQDIGDAAAKNDWGQKIATRVKQLAENCNADTAKAEAYARLAAWNSGIFHTVTGAESPGGIAPDELLEYACTESA